ncbi:Crp/Fnr family transcriptional regulator [Maribacter chungangensis]|uniref:Crp/Fnr family transcriptional regulator n=1 Tax=Maribacter chungangensis TaxID=1069117 RepID=A0ABW3B5S6_9FLAO
MKSIHETYISEYLKLFIHSTPEEIEFIRLYLNVKEYNRKDFFLKKDEVQKEMGYVSKGLLRRYYVDGRHRDITTGFIKESEYATDYPAFIEQRKTSCFIQCLEPTIIVALPFKKIYESYDNFKNSQWYGRLVAENALAIVTDRVESFLLNTAQERYVQFIKNNPALINRISLTHLSSFLGVERQSLSRIRKRLIEN